MLRKSKRPRKGAGGNPEGLGRALARTGEAPAVSHMQRQMRPPPRGVNRASRRRRRSGPANFDARAWSRRARRMLRVTGCGRRSPVVAASAWRLRLRGLPSQIDDRGACERTAGPRRSQPCVPATWPAATPRASPAQRRRSRRRLPQDAFWFRENPRRVLRQQPYMQKMSKFINTTCRCKWDLDHPKEQTNIHSNVPLDLPVCNAKATCKHARARKGAALY